MEYNSLVTVIIPTFNRGYIIEETLESVLNQTYSNWECIVVDDGGVDNTRELIEKFNKKKNGFIFVKRPNDLTKGVCACRNYGVELARGEFIVFLDSDDILAHNSLDLRVKYFKQNPNYDFLVFTTQFFKENISNKQEVINIDPIIENRENYLSLFLSHKFAWTVMSPIWKKSVLLKYKFRNDLHLLEDVVFHIEVLFDDKIKFKRINEIDNFYRIPNWGKNNSSSSTKRIFESTYFLLEAYNNKIKKSSFLEKKFSGFIKFVYSIILKSKSSYFDKKEMLSYLRSFKYITFKERLFFNVYFIIYFLKLNKVKHIGMYKLINYLNTKLFM